MCSKTGESMIEKPGQKAGKFFLVFAGICVFALPLIALSAFFYKPKEVEAAVVERTLGEYYSRRQYPGSPSQIPHPVEAHGEELECLACHATGGWTEILKNITPVTPHAEQVSCMQCHVRPVTDTLFKATDWQSVPPPRLGRSYLPGSPPPIPHDLQMRGNCIACHVGPGTVVAIRVEHASWGNCRQCHVPDPYAEPFQRNSESQKPRTIFFGD